MIIGIDLGTTNSLVAYYTSGEGKIIPNRLGKHLTPSVISVDEEGQVYVGETAKERMLLKPEQCAAVFKRDIGSNKEFVLSGKKFTATELSAIILRVLKEDAEIYLGEKIEEAIISVPAYFNDARRKATKQAGELAGLKVERMISEPTAAAIAYGLYENKDTSSFLVFDLGGGTFDVSILERYESILEVRAVAGDNYLGGEDFTNVIIDQFFSSQPQLERLSLDHKTLQHIKNAAEECKLNLSKNNTAIMRCSIKEEMIEYELSSEAYERACENLFDKIKLPIKRSLADAHIKVSDLDKVVLVGGGTKLPIVRRFVGRLFRNIPDTSLNPDEVVAIGAAIHGAMKEREASIKEVILTDVCPFTLGTEVVVNLENDRIEDGHFCPIIERNTVIPASRTQRLYTAHQNQTQIRVNVLQGESRFAVNNLSIGEILIDVPKNKVGEESIDITYTYDINALLEVEVKVVSTGKVIKQIFKGQNTDMTDQEIENRMSELAYLKIHPREQEKNKLALLKGERLYEESLGEQRLIIDKAIQKFEKHLDTHNHQIIEGERKRFIELLESLKRE